MFDAINYPASWIICPQESAENLFGHEENSNSENVRFPPSITSTFWWEYQTATRNKHDLQIRIKHFSIITNTQYVFLSVRLSSFVKNDQYILNFIQSAWWRSLWRISCKISRGIPHHLTFGFLSVRRFNVITLSDYQVFWTRVEWPKSMNYGRAHVRLAHS